MGHFSGYFKGASTFLTPKLSLEMAHKVICPQKKINLPHFQNQRYINSVALQCDFLFPRRLLFRETG
jgi:hypothetical protein